ncbi:hypothetical protein [Streptomyces spectabilis]|uniref:Uncharacterized protein n=1 Tax=Streptomyces spectabilis TaxID=68270 RepID=A0A516R456_STRST|nr:hypothetical protein [Streptomyces spectabilis]QDQ10428.1 hypothetical protein FH965_07485 [Streptomyces spectabilis]
MRSGQKTMTLFVTVILGLILVILGLSTSWPLWAWPATALLLLIIAAITHNVLSRGAEELPSAAALGPQPELFTLERPERRVTHVALPSATPDYDFSFAATVLWAELEAPEEAPVINAAGLAVNAILQRAQQLTEGQPPTRSAFVQHQLNGALGTMRMDPTGRVLAMAQDVSLSLPEQDRERLSKLSNVRKDEDVWEHERNYERSKRTYLGNDVLKDAGSAVVWWLSRNDEEVEGTVDRIGLLARLSAAANNDVVAPPFEHLVPPPPSVAEPIGTDSEQQSPTGWADDSIPYGAGTSQDAAGTDAVDAFLKWFGISPEAPERDLFVERLIKLAHAHDKPDVVDDIRRRFGPQDPDEGDDVSMPNGSSS